MSMASKVFRKYGTCKMEVYDHVARYFYQDDNYNWVEVFPSEFVDA